MDGLSIRVQTTEGVDNTFTLRPRILVDFEQKFGKGFMKLLGDDMRLEYLYYLGWSALKSNGIVVKPFGPDFLDTLVNVELVSDPSSVSTETA